MRKSFVCPLWGLILSALATGTAHAQLTSLTEGFDTVGSSGPPATGIFASGWVITNNSSPLGNHDWGQGIPPGQLNSLGANAQSGAPNSFIQTDFQAGQAGSGAIVSDWLITPVLLLENGATMSFYTQASPANTQFPNELQVWESQSGSSTVNVGSTAPNPGGDFTVKLLDINPGATNPSGSTGGYPTTWTQFTFTISGLSAPTDGRFGFRFYLPNSTDGTIVGVDTFSFVDPTVFTRTVSGNWTDTTGWTPNGVPNGNTVTAQLVTPGSGANSVNLGGGTFTVNQLQFFGAGAGTWDVINGTIVFDGTSPTFVNQGGSSGIVGLLPSLQLNANTTFEIDNASAVTEVTGTISGTGQLTKTGSGTLVLIGTNTYSGGTTISAGTLQIGNGGTTGSIVGNVADNGTLAFDRSDTVAFGSVISGTGSLVQLGSGTLVLTGNSTYTGGTTISAGTLQIGNGGTTGSITGNVTDNGTLAFNRSDAVTFAGSISGTGSLAQLGSGTVTLTGNNTYSGVTTISAGTLQIGNGGTSGSINGNVIDNGTLAFDRSDAVTFSGAISGTGSVLQLGSGTVTLTGNSTYAGGTTISAGTLQIGNGGTSGSITGNVTDNGALTFDRSDVVTFSGVISGTGSLAQLGAGTLVLTADSNFSGITTISAGILQFGNGGTTGGVNSSAIIDNGVLVIDHSDSFTYAGTVSGTGSGVKDGVGTLTLTGNNTYTGGTMINAGTLQLGNGGTTGSITGNVTDNSTLAFDRSDAVSFGGAISGTGNLLQFGSGKLTLTGNSSYSGGTTISNGTLQIGSGGTTGSIVGNVTDNGTLAFDRSDAVTFSGAISGTGSVLQLGSGTVTLTGNSTYAGGTTISAGTLQIGNGGTNGSITGIVTDNGILAFDRSDAVTFSGVITGAGSLVQLGSGALVLTANHTYSGGTTISAGTLQLGNGGTSGSIIGNVTDNGTLAFDRSDSFTFTGAISGTGTVDQIGTGTLTLTGNNTYSGPTNVSSGTLRAGSATAFSAISAFSLTGLSVLDLNGFDVSIGSLTGVAGATVSLGTHTLTAGGDNSSTTYAGLITGTGGLTKVGTGTLTLSGTSAYTGLTNINAGVLVGGALNSLSSFSAFVIANAASLDISLADQTIGSLAGTGGATVNLGTHILTTGGNDTSTTYAGLITGSGGLTKVGLGTLTLSGTSIYGGATNINAGVLAGGLPNALSQFSAFVIADGALLDIGVADQTIGSLAGAAGAFVNLGAHTLTTGGDNTSTLFAGTILGLGGGGLVKIGTGIFTLAGTNTYSGGTTVGNGTVVAAASGALGLGPVSVTGASSNLQINSSVTLNNLVSLNNGGTLNNSGLLNEGAANLNVTNGGTIVNNPSGTITANQIQFTLAPAILVNSGTINANVTFANFANMVQLFTGSSIVGNLNLGAHTGTELILDGSGTELLTQAITGTVTNSGSLVKQGTGTWTLDENLSIPVSTNVLAGFLVLDGQLTSPQVNVSTGATLQFGAGGSAGNLIGNAVVDNGSVIFNRSDSLTFNANISGSGGLNQNGIGTTVLGGANTYSGGTVINAGTLVVNSSQALGLGNVTLNSGTLKADPQPINVKGNYIQNVGGTLQLAVDGPNAGQYDFLNVTGNASLNGTLALANGGYNPQANDKLTLVTTGGTVTGKFAAFGNPFAHGTGYNLVDLVYGRNSVVLEFLNQTTPVSPVPPKVPTTPGAPPTVATINFSSFAQTPNQRAAASLLDPIQLDPKSATLMSYLYSQPTSRFPDDFAKISPEGLTAFYEISFSGANIQKLNLEGRLDDIRNGSNGFNSNVKINGGSVSGPEGKTTVDGKYSKSTLEPVLQSGPGNRWGVWLTGFGDFVDVDSDSNAKGYDFTTGGVSLGVDYRIIDRLAVGVMGSYSHTWTSLRPGHIGVDTGRGGIYATYFDRCFYLNGGIYGGYNSYDSSRDALGGMATGSSQGAEFSTFIGGGYDFHFGHLSFGPTGSLQYTNVYVDGFNEKNSLAPLRIHTDSEESLRTDLGFRAFYRWRLGRIALEPFLKAMWEHEFKYSALPITANLVGFSETSATFSGPAEGHDSAIVSAGVSVQWTPAISTYVNYDGQLGRDRYDSNAVIGGIRISF